MYKLSNSNDTTTIANFSFTAPCIEGITQIDIIIL